MATFQSQRKYTRQDFTPLSISCQLECTTPDSPVTQTTTATGYDPDRTETPCVIRPRVTVVDYDGVYPTGVNNASLSTEQHQWFVNGVAIAETGWSEGAGKDYEIVKDASEDNGSLKVYRNIPAGDSCELSYKGMFNDFRTGTNYVVSASGIVMTTTDKGDDEVLVSVNVNHLVYDMLQDGLLLYEYKKANGIAVSGSREDYINGTSYERTISTVVTKGGTLVTDLGDMTQRLVVRGETTALQGGTDEHPEIKSIEFPNITFDLRFATDQEYEVQILNKDGVIIARDGITLTWSMTPPTYAQPEKNMDIPYGKLLTYTNNAILSVKNRNIEYPELYFNLQWFTQARKYASGAWAYEDEIWRQIGESMSCSVDSMGMGLKYEDNQCDVAFYCTDRETWGFTADESGNILTDESGNVLIVNGLTLE